ncbi:glycoside hydrolase superfamily [Kockovaella imperatae]|uniref:Glycoside hydrolase superfamily n=1 Tax=Kockovaella imperatae TaxID=4999 RepID=A0A1Y1ULI9_9TREE|nr:glycoside hydrolase superfamily [Kockovaella imperatae]ORX38911.1 glycoside hydrolase superfamily [Kockovaella imperatae]
MYVSEMLRFSRLSIILTVFLDYWNTITSTVTNHQPEKGVPLELRVNLVHKNPGEGPTQTKYSDPRVVKSLGYNVMVKHDGQPPSAAITWETFDPAIFPAGSKSRQWVEDLAIVIDNDIQAIHNEGLKAMYWFDMFTLPKSLVERYGDVIVDQSGKWSMDSKQMYNITVYMLNAVFERFPALDGLLVRTGEIYTFDVPYHVGASPITDGYKSHIKLLKALEETVIKRHNKLLLYRTWSFDGFINDPEYYLNVTNEIQPHPNLYFVIKHTEADFWRTVKFNPTLGIGKHQSLVEIQCQREYEGKGATPQYVMHGVIDGFEEYNTIYKKNPAKYDDYTGHRRLKDLVGSPLFKGIVTWSRGGGWNGPYPADEFWIDMNVEVIARWALNPTISEEDVFQQIYQYMESGSMRALRQLALTASRGVLLGHYSLIHQLSRLEWTRDSHIGGMDLALAKEAAQIVDAEQVDAALKEKEEALRLWDEVERLAHDVKVSDTRLRNFMDSSINYAQLYYRLIATSWTVGLLGLKGNQTGVFEIERIKSAMNDYDATLIRYNELSNRNQSGVLSSLYTPFDAGIFAPGGDANTGASPTVNQWRFVVKNES